MADSLKSKTQKGILWSAIEHLGGTGIQFLISLVVARLLSPEDYGVIAIPVVFIGIAQVFISSGFGGALIRKPELSDKDLSTAFYFNIIVGIVCYALLFIASPYIASFYHNKILTSLVQVAGLALILNPLCIVQTSLLTRKIDFKKQAVITTAGTFIGGIVAILMAYRGLGVWSLVVQQVLTYVIRTIMLWLTTEWVPKSAWDKESFRYLWGFGSRMLGASLLDNVYKYLAPLIIGKFYTPTDLGEYTKGREFSTIPAQTLDGIMQRVTFPVLSSIQNDDERLRRNYRKMIELSCFVVFPIMLLLAALIKPVIIVILTDKWVGAAIYVQIICFASMWYPVHSINLNLLQVKGRSDLFLRLEIIKKIICIIVMLCTLPLGVIYFAASGILTSLISLFINTYYTGKYYQLPLRIQLHDIWPSFLGSILTWATALVTTLLISNEYVAIILGGILGVLVYWLFAKLFMKNAYSSLKSILPVSVSKWL